MSTIRGNSPNEDPTICPSRFDIRNGRSGGPTGLNSLLESVYDDCKKHGGTSESCSKQAWSAAKKRYYKDSKGKWRKRQ